MAEAWQVREGQRQELVENLMIKVFEQSESFDDEKDAFRFECEVAENIVSFLKGARFVEEVKRIPHLYEWRFNKFVHEQIWGLIKEFSRTPSERNALLVRFLERLLDSILNHFHAELTHDEIQNTRAVFGTDSAMDEVPFSKEENEIT